jgi:hypothetical protein
MINSLLFADNDGNALIFVSDLRHSAGSNLNYTVYKVSPTGELLWGNDGIDLERGETSSVEACIKAIQVEDGSYILAWQRGGSSGPMNVIVERLSRNGEFLWDAPLVLPTSTYPKLVNAGNNQAILVYAKGSNSALTVRKIDFDGSSVWSSDVQVYKGNYTIPTLEHIYYVTPDDKGGVFVGWYDDHNNTNRESAYVSYVKANGQLGFYTTSGSGEIKLGYGQDYLRQFAPRAVYDKTTDALYAVWRETNSSQSYVRIVIQKLSSDGELLWDIDGIQVAESFHPESVSYYTIQKEKAGRIAVFYAFSYYPYFEAINIAALYDDEGNSIWPNEHKVSLNIDNPEPITDQLTGILVSSFLPPTTSITGNKEGFASSPLIDGKYWLTLWEDYRDSSSLSSGGALFMQRVNIDGTLGPWTGQLAIQLPSVTSNGLTVNPSVIKGDTQFIFDNPKTGTVNISVYSLSGQKVAVVYDGKMDAGAQTISWNAKAARLSTGTYIIGVTTNEGSKSVKVVVI